MQQGNVVEGFVEGDEVEFVQGRERGVDERAEAGFVRREHGADGRDEAVAAGAEEVVG